MEDGRSVLVPRHHLTAAKIKQRRRHEGRAGLAKLAPEIAALEAKIEALSAHIAEATEVADVKRAKALATELDGPACCLK